MPYYEVTLRDADSLTTLNYEAPSGDVARQQAARATPGKTVTSVRLLTERPGALLKANVKQVKNKDLIRMCRSMGSMLNARIGLEDTLAFYANGLEDDDLKEALLGIRDRLVNGSPAPEAFANSGRFSEMFVGLVKAGTESATLGDAFRAIADMTSKTLEFRNRLKKALIVPTLVIFGVFNVFVASLTYQTPQLENMMNDMGAKPDPFSGFVFQLSHIVRAGWPFAYAVIAAVAATLFFSAKVREGLVSFIVSRWSVARHMVMGVRQLMILGTMNMVIKNGGSVADALSSASKVVAGTRIGEEIKLVAVKFASGLRLEESFRRYSGCDKQVSHMIGAGEKAGTLAEQLGLLTEMYEEQTGDAMGIFVGASSFLTLLIATAMIGFVFLSSVLPTVLMGPKMLEVMH